MDNQNKSELVAYEIWYELAMERGLDSIDGVDLHQEIQQYGYTVAQATEMLAEVTAHLHGLMR